jgi:hypothetical protein
MVSVDLKIRSGMDSCDRRCVTIKQFANGNCLLSEVNIILYVNPD